MRGRVVVGFRAPTRTDVDDVFRDMIGAGYRGFCKNRTTHFGARVTQTDEAQSQAA